MDSIPHPAPSTESSNTIPSKTNEQTKDSQAKLNPPSGEANDLDGASSSGSTNTNITATISQSHLTTSSTTTTAAASNSGSAPQSVTISLGVGALQVGKSQLRVPSPPKPVVALVSQDVTTTTSSSGTAGTISSVTTKDAPRSASSVAIPFTSSSSLSTTSTDTAFQNVTDSSKSSLATQNQPSVSEKKTITPVSSEVSTTGASSTPHSTTTMKRPPFDGGTTNSGATAEGGESDPGSEHKRKKMRKDTGRGDRSDSPGSTPHALLGRGIKGNTQGSPSASSSNNFPSTADAKGSNNGLSGKPSVADPTQAHEKGEDGNRKPADSIISSSSSSTSTSNTFSTAASGYGASTVASGSSGLKVPPLKIVLQPHSHSLSGTPVTTGASSTGKNSSEEASQQNTSFGGGVGLSYIVSSSNESNTTTTSDTSGIESGQLQQTGKGVSGDTGEKTSDQQNKAAQEQRGGASSLTSSSSESEGSGAASTSSHLASSVTVNLSLPTGVCGSFEKRKEESQTGNLTTAGDGTQGKDYVDEESKRKETANTEVASSVAAVASGVLNPVHHSHQGTHSHEKEKEVHSKEKESVQQPKADGSVTSNQKDKEKPVRVTRSSQRILKEGGGTHTPNSPSSSSPKTSACPSPSHSHQTDSQGSTEAGASTTKQGTNDGIEKMDTSEPAVDLHPRKRKIKNKEVQPAAASTTSTSVTCTITQQPNNIPCSNTNSAGASNASAETLDQQQVSNAANEQPMLNCFEMYLNIRKQIDRRRRNLFPVTPKPPKGFKDYLMNRGTYVLAGNANAVAVPPINPPSCLTTQMKEFFSEQEKERHKLRLQHLVEKEKLVLSVEQEILRVHGRAARALSNQTLPFSVCTILKDQEVYNLLTPEQEEKDINARSRYNGRLFLSWLQDVDDKWDKIKEYMLLRHHNEAESLHAVQKMDWEWKLKEFGLCEPKAAPVIDDLSVPMVHVSDDFDLGAA